MLTSGTVLYTAWVSCGELSITLHNDEEKKNSQIHSEKSGAIVIIAEIPIISILTGLIACHVALVRVLFTHDLFFG